MSMLTWTVLALVALTSVPLIAIRYFILPGVAVAAVVLLLGFSGAAASVCGVVAFVLAIVAALCGRPVYHLWLVRRLGWPAVIVRYQLRRVGPFMADPGNTSSTGHPRQIALFAVPAGFLGPLPTAVLIGINGTPEADGTHAPAAVVVPGRITNPLDAAAWAASSTRAEYAALNVRT